MIEIVAAIEAPNYFEGEIVLYDDIVAGIAEPAADMLGWTRDQVRAACRARGWKITVLRTFEHREGDGFNVGDSVEPRPGFEVVESNRPVIGGIVTKVEAFGLGQLVWINDQPSPFLSGYVMGKP